MPVFTRLYTGAGGTPKNAKAALVVTSGKQRCVAVPFPSTGFVTRLIVKQTGGTNVAFEVELLCSKLPYAVGEQTLPATPSDDIELYRIVGKQSGTSGNALQVINQEQGYPYINVDGTPTNNERFIYVVIIPTSAGTDTTWDLSITCHDNYGA